MKKIFVPLLLLIVVGQVWCQPDPGFQQSWKQYRFGIRLIGGAVVEGGDLDGRDRLSVNPKDTAETRGDLLLGDPQASLSYGVGIGVRMDDHRLALSALWAPSKAEHRDVARSAAADLMSVSIDYRFDFFQDRLLRPSVGGGAHFAMRDLEAQFLPETGKPRSARVSGNGFQLAAGLGWWWSERVAILIETEYRFIAYRNIGLGDEGFVVDGYLIDHAWSPHIDFWIFF